MEQSLIFHLISDISKETKAIYVLIGGFAVNYYKVTRQTQDVDFLTTEDDFRKIEPLLEKAGYKKDFTQEAFARFSSKKLYLIDIDFMFVDKDTLGKILKDAKKISIAEREFIVPSLNNLIALKLHSLKFNLKSRQNKDIPDIINLVMINKLDYKTEEFKQLCLKYGTEGIYRKILEGLS